MWYCGGCVWSVLLKIWRCLYFLVFSNGVGVEVEVEWPVLRHFWQVVTAKLYACSDSQSILWGTKVQESDAKAKKLQKIMKISMQSMR